MAPKPASELTEKEAAAILAGKAPVEKVPWTAEMALKVAGVSRDLPSLTKTRRLKAAVREGRLGPGAVAALKAAGYSL